MSITPDSTTATTSTTATRTDTVDVVDVRGPRFAAWVTTAVLAGALI
ncbi:MAG TPA: DUF4395 domain-containing protein, partial [Mycobacterium sp.]|nr:DUF4395 domain-containing protein [Mycobacterium sp.]